MNEIVVVCKCPICCKVYNQRTAHRWCGPTWRPRAYEHALFALCEENGQGKGKTAWAGLAYCMECSLRRLPPSLRETIKTWLQYGEF